MAEFPAPETARSAVVSPDIPTGTALLIYALYGIAGVSALVSAGLAIAPLFGLIGFIGLVLAYVRRDDARGTWLESHFHWQIRTFWFALLWAGIGWVLAVPLAITIVGLVIPFAILGVTSLWILYRVIRGFLRLNDRQPMPGM